MKLALIDLGSNSARMYILNWDGERFSYLSRRRVMTRLSQGMSEDRCLIKEPMERTVDVMKVFAEEIRAEGASVLAIATAAVRKAKNGAEFCSYLKERTGINLNVISGETEAYLDFQGVLDGLPGIEDCVITDTGGGSTEVILVKNKKVIKKISLPFGAVSLTESFKDDNAAEEYIAEQINNSGILAEAEGLPVVGLGGSICAVAVAHMMHTSGSAEEKMHGYTMSMSETEDMYRGLYLAETNERIAFGIEKERADTVCNGILPTLHIMKKISSPALTICRYGLREGIMAEMKKGDAEGYIRNPQSFMDKYVDVAENQK